LCAGGAAVAAEPAEISSFLRQYCYRCHGEETSEAELDLRTVSDASGFSNKPKILERMRDVLELEVMPPSDAQTQPAPRQRRRALEWLNHRLKQLERLQQNDPGAVVMPRLTAAQYDNAIRDLTGLDRNAGRFFPADGGAGEGFNNVGQAQPMTLSHLEKYLNAARNLAAHLRASPAHDWQWSETRLAEVPTPEQRQQELFLEVRRWFWDAERRIVGGHLDALDEHYEMSHGVYWEAAWRYQHRDKLGMDDTTLEEIAAEFESALLPTSLQRWWEWLTDDSLERGLILQELVRRWRALPEPDDGQSAAPRDQLRALDSWFSGVAKREQRMRWAPDWEVSFEWRKYRKLARKGRWPMKLQLGDAEAVYLVVTPALEQTRDDRVVWRRGRFYRSDDDDASSVTPWNENSLTVETVQGEAPVWTNSTEATERETGKSAKGRGGGHGTENGDRDDQPAPSEALEVPAPSVLKIVVPKGAKFLEVEAAISGAEQSVVQVAALPEPPSDQDLSLLRDRVVLSQGESDAFERYDEARKLAENVRTERNEEPKQRGEVLWYVDGLEPRHLGGEWSTRLKEKDRPKMPYYYPTGTLRDLADQPHRGELEQLESALVAEARRPVQDLRVLLERQGVELDGDRMTVPAEPPAQATIERSPPAVQARYRKLKSAIAKERQQWADTARGQLRKFTSRAWRRPVSPSELDWLVEKFLAELDRGASYDVAIKVPLRIVLVSPHFLFLHQTAQFQPEPYKLNAYELASRLSFALWASIPDAELRELAASGELVKPRVLRDQAARMLADPKARALATEFAGQWFKFNGFEKTTSPDPEKFPEFDQQLAELMYRESMLFFDDLFRNDRSILSILEGDYTFANGRLASHYGVEGIGGEAFQRIALPRQRRAGVLSHGSFLVSTSQPQRTSPVKRGVWVIEEILGRHIPNPPPNVPELSDAQTNDEGLTIPEQLARHRADASCASCHQQIDPLGLALEHLDPIGRWRTERSGGRVIESSGEISGSGPLENVADLQRYLTDHRDEFLDHFARKLAGYTLGRSVETGDAELLRGIKRTLHENDYRFSAALIKVVSSRQFRYRRDRLTPDAGKGNTTNKGG
jgi:hypothetical protein